MTQRSTKLKPWTVFYPVTVLGKVVDFDRFDVEEPTIPECLNGYVYWNRDPKGRRMIRERGRALKRSTASPRTETAVSFCGYGYVRFDGGFFVAPTTVDNWRAAHAT